MRASPKHAIALALLLAVSQAATAASSLVIENVAIVDVERGEVVAPRVVVITDGRITAVEKPGAHPLPPGAQRVDGRGGYLMPGLIDMHVHVFNNASGRPPNEWAFPLFVANGVTGVRDMLTAPGSMELVRSWRTRVEQGELVAPRILAAGMVVTAQPGAPVSERVGSVKSAGADFVKVFSDVSKPDWRATMDAAKAARLPVAGHVPAGVGLLEAARAGQRTDEHLTQVYEACCTREQEMLAARAGLNSQKSEALQQAQEADVLRSFDPLVCNETAAALARTGQVQVPTLVLPYFEARGSARGFRQDSRWHLLRPDEQARWEKLLSGRTNSDANLVATRWEVSREIVRILHSAGVRILAGTDTPMPLVYPGSSLHKELELLVESGLSAVDALRAATIWPAQFLGSDNDLGAVAAGKCADLVLLDADPLMDIRHTTRIRAVILGGRLFERRDLDTFAGRLN